jgi:membrane protein YqaA with SNARE-associated domain
MTVHGMFLDTFKTCTIIAIPKDAMLTRRIVRSNYRGIALSSTFGNIFYSVILLRYHDKLVSSDLQFGFKAKHSTNHCTMILKETIAYYVRNQSSVFLHVS